jgi:threonine/homoserine/homoserine lactone efflux protein
MKTNMEDIDKLIKETLTQEEAKFYDELDEQNVLEMLGGLFKGKNSWIMYVMNFMTLVFFVGFIVCVVKFFDTENTNELIMWSVGGIISLLAVSMLKIFAWLQMDKNALLREMKRLELQISSLSGKMS